jgi:hypothetical protein
MFDPLVYELTWPLWAMALFVVVVVAYCYWRGLP